MFVASQVNAVFEDRLQIGHEVEPTAAAVHVALDFVLDATLTQDDAGAAGSTSSQLSPLLVLRPLGLRRHACRFVQHRNR